MRLIDGSIALRDWRGEDADAVVRACSDPEIPRWIPFIPVPYSFADAERYIEDALASGDERVPLAIVTNETDELLGSIDMRVNARLGIGHIGYWVAPWARRRGVCTAALALICRHGFDDLRLARLELVTDPENHSSQRVAEKVGFQREGVLRSHLEHRDGRRRDSVMFSLLPGELR